MTRSSLALTITMLMGAVAVAPASGAQWRLFEGAAQQSPSHWIRAAVTVDGKRLTRFDTRYEFTCRRGGAAARRSSHIADYSNIRVRNGRFAFHQRFRQDGTGYVDEEWITGRVTDDGITGTYRFYTDFGGNRCDTGTVRFELDQIVPATLTGVRPDGTAVTVTMQAARREISSPTVPYTLEFAAPVALRCEGGDMASVQVRWPGVFDFGGWVRPRAGKLGRLRIDTWKLDDLEITQSASATGYPLAVSGSLRISRSEGSDECRSGVLPYEVTA